MDCARNHQHESTLQSIFLAKKIRIYTLDGTRIQKHTVLRLLYPIILGPCYRSLVAFMSLATDLYRFGLLEFVDYIVMHTHTYIYIYYIHIIIHMYIYIYIHINK